MQTGRIFSSHADHAGDVHDVTFHPDDVDCVIAAVGSEVHASADRGTTWRAVATGLPDEDVVSVSVDLDDPTVLYAAALDSLHVGRGFSCQ